MSDDAEQQAEEIEVLKSIYEGDENFKQVNATTYHYKVNIILTIFKIFFEIDCFINST